jgi:cytochrome oxidase Cu insertion factor (SCO1/SenC/PrrC family)
MMKRIFYILVFMLVSGSGVNSMNAQNADQKEKVVFKTSVKETPAAVKEALKNYSGYKISSKATYTKTGKGKIYKVKVERGHFSNFLVIDEKGRVLGIETGEHPEK